MIEYLGGDYVIERFECAGSGSNLEVMDKLEDQRLHIRQKKYNRLWAIQGTGFVL